MYICFPNLNLDLSFELSSSSRLNLVHIYFVFRWGLRKNTLQQLFLKIAFSVTFFPVDFLFLVNSWIVMNNVLVLVVVVCRLVGLGVRFAKTTPLICLFFGLLSHDMVVSKLRHCGFLIFHQPGQTGQSRKTNCVLSCVWV